MHKLLLKHGDISASHEHFFAKGKAFRVDDVMNSAAKRKR